jgi:hypothetical protein
MVDDNERSHVNMSINSSFNQDQAYFNHPNLRILQLPYNDSRYDGTSSKGASPRKSIGDLRKGSS